MIKKTTNSSKRLQEMLDILHLKQSDVVERTGITKSALSNYLHGTREPRQDQISKIADPYKINPTWLMGYDVPMYMDDLNDEFGEHTPFETDRQKALLTLYLSQLNEDGFQEALKRIEELTELGKYKKDES